MKSLILFKQNIQRAKILFLLAMITTLSACSSPSISDYSQTKPNFDVINYFSGELEAKGVVMNRSGFVTRRFSVKMQGTIENEVLTLEEWFVFDDGEKTQRTWVIKQNSDGSYTGTANDIAGTAKGESQGMALRWDYELDLVVEGTEYRVLFDDWLYLIDDNNAINRSVIKKWGFNVGEVILSIRKI